MLISNVIGYAAGTRITRRHMTSLVEAKVITEIQTGGSKKSWTWKEFPRRGRE